MESMKRCAVCGLEVQGNFQFCPNCGSNQFYDTKVRCPACGNLVPPFRYCGHCGADLQNPSAQVWRVCGNCGNPVHITHTSCARCGAGFVPPQVVAQPQPQPVKPKKKKNVWLPILLAVLLLLGGIGAAVGSSLESRGPQLNMPHTTASRPGYSRPTLPKLPEFTHATEPTAGPATQPKPTEPETTQPKPTQPKPTEPKPTQTKPTEPTPTQTQGKIPGDFRDNYYLAAMGDGYCETLTGDVVVVIIFVTDPTDGWTASEQSKAEEKLVEQLRTLLGEAEAYGADLKLRYATFSVTIDVEFDRDSNNWKEAAMAQAGLSDGYTNQRKLEEYYEADQVPVVFMVDESGRSYANLYQSGKGFECVTILEKDYAALRHEMCHVFGARDMYFPQETVDAAKEFLPDGIMYGDCEGAIDPLTAFVIGWMEELTEEAKGFLYATNDLTEEYIAEAKELDQLTGFGTRYYDNGYYVGELLVGVRHGEGTYYWDSGAVYTGTWVNGEREGQGTMTYDDGAVYTGAWKDNERNGKGKITFTNGNSYNGKWKNDQYHGTGTFTWADGTVYKGDWSKGERTGEGTMTWPSGDKYVGKFKNGNRHGKGTYYFPNGNVYEGDWVDGDRTGKGTFTWKDGSWYTGDFVKNQMTGKGERYYASYGTRYVGDFVDGKRHGYGTYYYADGTTWTGYWENDVRQD